jgi:starch synthase
MDGIPEEDLKVLDNPDYINYCKLVINMSDGLIIGSKEINKDVLAYARKSGKLVLDFQDSSTYVDAYSVFYDQVVNHISQ